MSEGNLPLGQPVLRALGDRLYEKRKGAALEIERTVRELFQRGGTSAFPIIRDIIALLKNDFAYNVLQNNSRNGGLIGLAGVAIALGPELLPTYLDDILPPILACFNDQDSKVRYYACESLYNVAKVARKDILRWFNEIFDVLSHLAADTDAAVKNAAELLDRLLKDIVSEQSIDSPLQEDPDAPSEPPSTDEPPPITVRFSLQRFIPLLSERIHTLNTFTRLFLVSWITLLDSVPELELVSFLPEFLDGLFKYLSDDNEQVRVGTASILSEFLRQIREAVEVQQQDSTPKGTWVPGLSVNVRFASMVEILQPYLVSMDEETMSTALRWMNEFILIAHKTMITFTPALINTVLPCLAHTVPSMRAIAVETNKNLFNLIRNTDIDDARAESSASIQKTESEGSLDRPEVTRTATKSEVEKQSIQLDYQSMVGALVEQFLNENEESRVSALEWMLMLHKKAPIRIASHEGSFVALLQILTDSSDEVVRRALQLLAQISLYSDDEYFLRFASKILSIFSSDRRLLETRGSLIIRQLCLALTPEKIYRCFAEILEKDEDLEFASTMVQNLNLILITAAELSDLRARLRTLDTKDGQGLFTALYRCWCHNPVSTFSLCLLAQAYEHATHLLQVFTEIEITVNFLVQIDKLVQLLESPVFTYLRLQLLEPEKNPHLYKCLYGLLMMLPQSSAFATLRNRLNSVSSVTLLHLIPRPVFGSSESLREKRGALSSSGSSAASGSSVRFQDLASHFRHVQSKHEKTRKSGLPLALQGLSLTSHESPASAPRKARRPSASTSRNNTSTDIGNGAAGGMPQATKSRSNISPPRRRETSPSAGARDTRGTVGTTPGPRSHRVPAKSHRK